MKGGRRMKKKGTMTQRDAQALVDATVRLETNDWRRRCPLCLIYGADDCLGCPVEVYDKAKVCCELYCVSRIKRIAIGYEILDAEGYEVEEVEE